MFLVHLTDKCELVVFDDEKDISERVDEIVITDPKNKETRIKRIVFKAPEVVIINECLAKDFRNKTLDFIKNEITKLQMKLDRAEKLLKDMENENGQTEESTPREESETDAV